MDGRTGRLRTSRSLTRNLHGRPHQLYLLTMILLHVVLTCTHTCLQNFETDYWNDDGIDDDHYNNNDTSFYDKAMTANKLVLYINIAVTVTADFAPSAKLIRGGPPCGAYNRFTALVDFPRLPG